jgi:hypothetical protein
VKEKDRILALLAMGFLAGPIVVQAQYHYQQLDYPGTQATQVFGVNDRGDVLGNGYGDPDIYPFVYELKKGTITDVAPLAGYSTTVVAINGRGDIVGSVDDGTTASGFIRDKQGNFTVFSHPDAVFLTNARGVNNGGLVTGFRDDENGLFIGFIYDSKSGIFTDLIPKSVFTIAQGINKRGEVVGDSIFLENDPCPGLSGNRYGWFRAADGIVTYFEVNGSSNTRARGITNEGLIIGAFFDAGDGRIKGFRTELTGPPPCLSITVAADNVIEFPGAVATFPQDITKAGDISGSYLDPDGNFHGFIATPQ